MIEAFKALRKTASEFAAKNLWKGVLYTKGCDNSEVYTFNLDHDWYKCEAVANQKITAKEMFEILTEGTNASQFYMRHPNGTEINHNSYMFSCTITEDDGSSREYKGIYRDIKMPNYTASLSNVKVIE